MRNFHSGAIFICLPGYNNNMTDTQNTKGTATSAIRVRGMGSGAMLYWSIGFEVANVPVAVKSVVVAELPAETTEYTVELFGFPVVVTVDPAAIRIIDNISK